MRTVNKMAMKKAMVSATLKEILSKKKCGIAVFGADRLIIGSENKSGNFSQNHSDAHRHEDLVFGQNRFYLHQWVEGEFLNGDTQQKECGHADQQREVGIDAQVVKADKCHIHGHHHQLAVGQVYDTHNAHDKRHTDADQAVKAAFKYSGHQGLKKNLHRLPPYS